MSTTGMVMSITDELLAELEAGINSMTMRTAYVSLIVAEIGRLRAENAEMAKDAGRYRWIVKKSTYGISYRQCPELTLPIYAPDHRDGLGDAIDTAMAAQ